MECHHQGFVAVAHIDKGEHARTDPEFWKFGTLERMRERPPQKKQPQKNRLNILPEAKKIKVEVVPKLDGILGTKDLRDTASVNWDDMTYTVCLGLAAWKGGYGLGRCQSQYTR